MLFNDGGDEDELDYGSQLVDRPVMVKANCLNYARKAKRVDVRKLKHNIWKELVDQKKVLYFSLKIHILKKSSFLGRI